MNNLHTIEYLVKVDEQHEHIVINKSAVTESPPGRYHDITVVTQERLCTKITDYYYFGYHQNHILLSF